MPRNLGNFARVCREDGCDLEAAPRRQWCEECWLNRQPPVIRAQAAERRLSLIPEVARRARIPEADWPPGRRWCSGCQTFMRLQDCTGSRCKACVSAASHASRIKATFGVDRDTYDWLFKLQGGKCAICRARPKTVRMAIDHDHKHCKDGCQRCIRGLLCAVRCNHDLLGAAHDSIEILENAIAYLKNPPWQGNWEAPERERTAWAEANNGDPPPPF